MRTHLIALWLIFFTAAAHAQTVIPIRYRVTRTAPSETTMTHVFLKTAMTCGVPRGVLSSAGLIINDPANDTLDCQWLDLTNVLFQNMRVGLTYTYTIAGQANDLDPYGPESGPATFRYPAIPGVPPNFRIYPPPTMGVAAQGVVQGRAGFVGLDVANVWLPDIGTTVYFGASSLSVPGYSVRTSDRFAVMFWREP